MTTPPPGESGPDDERPPPGQWQPGPPPPPGYPYYPGPPPPPGYHSYGPPPPQPRSRIAIGTVFAGSGLYFAINLFVGIAVITFADSAGKSANVMLAGATVMLLLIAFAGGAGLLASGNRYAKGLGLGLMIGWALTSLFTVGFCTGINPAMYTSS
ncbi:MAG: hypothetical protein U0Q47_10265 [Mycobacterium sp.]